MANKNFKARIGIEAPLIAADNGTTAITLSDNDVTVVGDLTVTSNTIKSSSATALSLSGANVTVAGTLEIDGNQIKASDGTTALTLSATTGDVAVAGDLTVTGNNIFSSTGDSPIAFSGADVTVAGDLTVSGNDIKSSTGTALTLSGTNVTVAGDLTVSGRDITTGADSSVRIFRDTGVTNLVANPLTLRTTSSLAPAIGLGTSLSFETETAADVFTQGSLIRSVSTNVGSGTESFNMEFQLSNAGSVATKLTLDSLGNLTSVGNLDVQGGTITESTGALSITTGAANGNITLDPNGTGNVVLTLADGGNLTNTRNYVAGAIRNSTTASIGDIWALNSTGPTNPFRGVSIDNSADNTKGAGAILRSYSNANGLRGRVVFERARGSLASPAALQTGNIIGSVDATGYTSTGWLNDNIAAVVPAFFGFSASENWVSNTNIGSRFFLSLAPTATTITDNANLITTIESTPESTALRSDRLAFSQGKTSAFTATGCSTSGTTLTIGTLVTGTIAVGNVITVASSVSLQNFYIIANISGSGSGSTWTLNASPGTLSSQAITGNIGYIGGTTSASVDMLADLKLLKNTIKGSGGTTQIVTSSAGATLELRGDNIQLENAAGTSIVGSAVSYNRVYGQFEYNTTVTPAAADTAAVFPLGTAAISNIVTVGSTSRLIAGAAGIYNLQFSIQVENADNANDHDAYIWLRKNGTDVTGSMGRTTVAKNNAGSLKIIAWNYIVSSANVTDYWEIAYAVSDTDVTFPAFAATAFGPSTATIITSLTPVGA